MHCKCTDAAADYCIHNHSANGPDVSFTSTYFSNDSKHVIIIIVSIKQKKKKLKNTDLVNFLCTTFSFILVKYLKLNENKLQRVN